MVLSKKSRGKLSANHRILLRELEELAVEDKPPLPAKGERQASRGSPRWSDDLGHRPSGVPELKVGLTPPPKKRAGRPKGPTFINTARLLTG